jgi:hypothetical protein
LSSFLAATAFFVTFLFADFGLTALNFLPFLILFSYCLSAKLLPSSSRASSADLKVFGFDGFSSAIFSISFC